MTGMTGMSLIKSKFHGPYIYLHNLMEHYMTYSGFSYSYCFDVYVNLIATSLQKFILLQIVHERGYRGDRRLLPVISKT